MNERLKDLGGTMRGLVVATAQATGDDDVPRLAAAMAYWLLVTLAPLVLVLSTVGSVLFRNELPTGPAAQVADMSSVTAAQLTGSVFAFAGPFASVLAGFLVLLGAIAVFAQFVGAVNIIWKTPPQRGAIYEVVRHNLLAFLLLVVFAFGSFGALMVGLTLQRALGLLAEAVAATGATIPLPEQTGVGLDVWVGVLAAWGMFAVAFWIVPQRKVRLLDVLPGALLTAVAYQIGASVVSSWLQTTTKFEVYGVFGLFVGAIVFIYYIAYIALVGAEFTHQWVLMRESVRSAGEVDSADR